MIYIDKDVLIEKIESAIVSLSDKKTINFGIGKLEGIISALKLILDEDIKETTND